jgi:hypothetical protein
VAKETKAKASKKVAFATDCKLSETEESYEDVHYVEEDDMDGVVAY